MKANTNSYKHHHKSCIHPRTSLPLLAAGCFALIGSGISKAAINVNWDGGAGTAFWDDNNNWSPDANVDGASDSSGYAAFITDADTVIRDSRTIYRTNTNASAGNTASTTIGSGGSLTMDNGQRLNWNGGASVGDSTLTIENGGSLSAGFFDTNQGAGSSATFEVLSGGTATFASTFSMNDAAGTGNVIVDGSGSVITVAGNTTINGSAGNTLTISNGGTFTAGADFTYGPATLSIGGGGSRFELGSGSTDGAMTNLNAISIASGGTFVINQSDAVTQGTEFGNSISGAGSIEQAGTGTTTLNVANTHTGGTTLSDGRLHLGAIGAAGTGTLTLSGGILTGLGSTTAQTNDIVVTDATSTAIFSDSGSENRYSGNISGSGTLNFGGTGSGQGIGTVRIYNLDNFTGTINHEAGSGSLFMEPGAQTQTTTAKISTSGATNGAVIRFRGGWTIGELSGTGGKITGWTNETLTINQSTNTTYSGHISDNGTRVFSIIKDGSGSLTLGFANTYTGATTVNAGTITLTDAGRIGNGGLTVNNGGTLSIANDDFNSLDGAITINEGGTLSTDSTGNNAHNIGAITLNGGTLTSSGNTWSEGNWIFNGDVTVGGSALSTISGLAVGSKNGGGTYNVADSVAGSGTDLLVTAQMVDATGGSYLTKTGAGTMELTGANTYTGTTTVNAGTLSLASGSSHSGTGAYTVNSGILEIATGVDLSSHAMTIAGVISPGNSPGTAATGSQTWLDGGSYLWEVNASGDAGGTQGADPGWDWIDITGTLDLSNLTAGGFTIDIDSLTASNVVGDAVGFDTFTQMDGIFDYSFIIASADSGITGFDAANFTLDSSGFSNAPSWDWQIVLSGNDLVLEAYAVPEPSSTALLGLGGLALALRRKR